MLKVTKSKSRIRFKIAHTHIVLIHILVQTLHSLLHFCFAWHAVEWEICACKNITVWTWSKMLASIWSVNATIFMWYTSTIQSTKSLPYTELKLCADQKKKPEIAIECEHIRTPAVPSGIFNAIYLVNLNSASFFCVEIENRQLEMQQQQHTHNSSTPMFGRKTSCISVRMCVHHAHMHTNTRSIKCTHTNTMCNP